MSTINERIAQVVAYSGLTKTDFAERIGVSQPFVSRLCMNGTPSDRTINDICREFGVNEVWLRTGDGDMLRPVSRSEEIAAYMAELLGGARSGVEEAFVLTMAKLPPQLWPVISQALDVFCDEYIKNKKDKE